MNPPCFCSEILLDPQKRAIFDQSGSDPEDRSGGMRPSGFSSSPFARGGGGFEGELSPEDLFNMFFGGGGGASFGGGFGGAPGSCSVSLLICFLINAFSPIVFTTSFGPGGFRTTRMGGQPRQQANVNAEPRSIFMQLLPLIILFGFSLLSALPSLFTTPPIPDPRYSFVGTSRYNIQRQTGGLGVRYHVNAGEFMTHPVIGPELLREGVDLRKNSVVQETKKGAAVTKFEGNVEQYYKQDMYTQCQRGMERKERAKEAEIGLFAIGTDWEKVRSIDAQVVESCEELKRLGVRI